MKLQTKIRTRWIIIIGGSAAVVLAVVLVSWLMLSARTDAATQKILVYYYNPSVNCLESETRVLPAGDENTVIHAAITMLGETPRNTALIKKMPDTEGFFTGFELNGTELTAVFSQAYYDLPPLDEAIFRASFIWTLTELSFIEQVRIQVGDEALFNSRGVVRGSENRLNVSIRPTISPELIITRSFTLYFVSAEADRLIAEARTTDDVNSDQFGEYIMNQLIAGPPDSEGYLSVIPADTKVREVKTEDNICYVNLSGEFNSKFSGNPALARLMIYSIVNTLTENLKVKRVQFLIESVVWDQYQGLTDFNRLFEKDESFNTAPAE